VYGNHQLTFEQRLAAPRQVTNILRMNGKHVVARPDGLSADSCSERFDSVDLNNDTPENLRWIAAEAMPRTILPGFSDRISAFLPQAAAIARQRMPYFHPNAYYGFVDCVVEFTTVDYRDALSRNENAKVALEFLFLLQGESHEIDSRLNSLAPTLERLQIDLEAL
jgi:hypothetical protein